MVDADPFEQLLREALAPTYLLVRKLGAGGMGSVYLARDPTLKRNVAVKVLAPELADDPGPRARFQREAEAVAALSHPNVVAVYNVGRLANGVPYFVMQFVNGRSTADRIETDGPFDGPSTKRYLGEVASALAAAHRQGIIHRDIKPANVLIDDESDRALVSDFGIAAMVRADGTIEDAPLNATRPDIADLVMTRLTQTGATVGTPAYMSPEQLLGEPVTAKTDVYALGLLGYEWLTGKGPYEISSPSDVIVAHIRDTPKPLLSVRKDVDPEVDAVLRACLAKDAAARPAAAEAATRLGHGPDVLLEWPPPGLEKLHGQLRLATLAARIGGLMLGVPMAIVTALEGGHVYRQALPPTTLLVSIAGFGALLLGVAGVRLLQLARGASAAARVGHGWLTVAEVLADHRRDGGALMVGAREYATLTVAQRSQYRMRRLLAAALALAAGAAPMLGYFVAIFIGRFTSLGPAVMLVLVLIVPIALWLFAANVGARESHALAEPRERLRRAAPPEAVSRLVDRWRTTFEEARQGQRIGLGVIGRPMLLLAVGVVLAGTLLGGTILSSAVGAAGVASDHPYYAEVLGWGNDAIDRFVRDEARRLAPYRTPVDSSVTALRAGEAMHAMMAYSLQHLRREDFAGTDEGRRAFGYTTVRSPLEREAVRRIAGSWWTPPLDSLVLLNKAFRYTTTVAPSSRRMVPQHHWYWVDVAAIPAAANGLSPDYRRALQRIASGAPLAEFSVVARAGSTDLWGASLRVPIPDAARFPFDLSGVLTSWSLEHFAHAVVAQAALDLADGRRSAAEAQLRDVLGAGLAMLEDRSQSVSRIGRVISETGRDALASFYGATGRPVLRNAVLDTTFFPRRSAPNVSSTAHMAAVDSAIADTTLLPSARWDLLFWDLPVLACRDLRLLLFPNAPEYARLWSQARAELVRDSVGAAIFTYARSRPDYPQPFKLRTDLRSRTKRAGMRGLDLIVGGHRFETCLTRFW